MKRETIFITLSVLGCVAALFWGISVNNRLQSTLIDLQSANATIATERQQHQEALASVQEQSAETLQAAEGRWSDEKENLEERNAERIAAAKTQFSELMENGERSLSYIGNLESKLRSGKKLSEVELEKLGAIAQGLDQLRIRYKQPMQEFTELGTYFERRANQNIQAPDSARFKRVRRLFSKDYREQEQAYQQQVGQKAAYEEALTKFNVAYESAQKRIDEAAKGMAAYSQRIYALISEKEQSQEDLEAFFTQSRQAIQTHLEIIDLDTNLDPNPLRQD